MSNLSSYLRSLPFALGYVVNYNNWPANALGHLWSVSCEMQFYLVAPIIYLAGGATPARRNAVYGFLLLGLFVLGATSPLVPQWKYHFEFAVWPMMFGFWCEHMKPSLMRVTQKWAARLLSLGVVLCTASLVMMTLGSHMKAAVIATGSLLQIPCLMAYVFGRPLPGIMGRSLKWLGQRTYSIYLWQEPLTICNFIPQMLQPLGALVAVGVGAGWFHLLERPFLSVTRRGR
jgi:peptidoglycan/LPS O-acetylase OafA/YrhL